MIVGMKVNESISLSILLDEDQVKLHLISSPMCQRGSALRRASDR